MSSRVARIAFEGLRHAVAHPVRTALTALTCAVAIAVTVNVISLNYGLDEDIRHDIHRFGRLTIDVGRSPILFPGQRRADFGDADVERIRAALAGLDATIAPTRQRPAGVRGDVAVDRLSIVGTVPAYLRTVDVPLVAGRWFDASETRGAAVLDRHAAKTLFPSRAPADVVGRTIAVEGLGDLRVVGVLEDPMTYRELFAKFDENRRNRTMTGSLLMFQNVYVGADAIGTADLSGVAIALPDEPRLDEAARRLGALYPRIGPESLVGSPISSFVRGDWMKTLGGTTQAGALLGNAVWILVVLVACVMISTLNLITIRERYDELAIRRCEGARRRDVVAQVTAEGLLVSLAGGLAGLPLGYVAAAAMRRIVDVPFRFDPRYAFVAIVVAMALGLLSSVLPARRAAALDPAAVLSRRLL
jgi:ABC-type antimicrobial peptide transport system permease subunit